jgi:DinB superfamily
MISQLDDLKGELLRLTQHARTLIAPFSEVELAASLPEGGWSVGQCFTHLDTVGRSYLKKLSEAVDNAHTRGLRGSEPYWMSPIGRWFVHLQEPPVRLKIGAPAAFAPSDLAPTEAFARYLDMHDNFAEVMTRAKGLPLSRITITSETRLRLSVFTAFHATLAHERRHLWQIERILSSVDLLRKPIAPNRDGINEHK